MPDRAHYSGPIAEFLATSGSDILGRLCSRSTFPVEQAQKDAWAEQIGLLRAALSKYAHRGSVYFEYEIPRMGRRIDVVVALEGVLFVIEFKVGDRDFKAAAIDQVWDYALDLKNFHETSHHAAIAPVLVATRAPRRRFQMSPAHHGDDLVEPICSSAADLEVVIADVLAHFGAKPQIHASEWESGRYSPTPTIVEAAVALYAGHDVKDISRNDAGAVNLRRTSDSLARIIRHASDTNGKCVCFVTGVPGAGKTLVGLNVANQHQNPASELYSVFLSGNGPLVAVLQEALARDEVRRERLHDRDLRLGEARSRAKAFVQNVHHFRDEGLRDFDRPPIEHVVLFDEAQRAWNLDQTARFMLQKKKRPGFSQSEPEFLISCMDRHKDWAVVVCLIGGGQEINTGEAGIGEWVDAILRSFPHWHIHISPNLRDSEFGAGAVLGRLDGRQGVSYDPDLHLSVSMRSFRAEHVSALVKAVLDRDVVQARHALGQVASRYPIVLTRELAAAKQWLRERARGSERTGVVVSSQAQRLKPHAIDIRAPINPVHWFLGPKSDVRSSYYLEDAATEFHVQGLELDWAAVVWDGDLRATDQGWEHFAFHGSRWKRIRQASRQNYLKNAYRVLLTRARQGMAVVVPRGDPLDSTRDASYYDGTYAYLQDIGLQAL